MSRFSFWSANRKSTRELMNQQIDITLEGVRFALELVESPPGDRAEARAEMAEIEHEGDDARAEVVGVMLSKLSTPLDREDLFRASRSIDDVLDNTRDFVREMTMWKAAGGKYSAVGFRHVIVSLEKLRDGIENSDPADVRINVLSARKEAGQVRRAYQNGLKHLFTEDLTMETLKTRELLRRLDVIGLRLIEAADALLDGLIKRAI